MTKATHPFTAHDVLNLAMQRVKSGQVKENPECRCGKWCPRCAAADAKSELDKRFGCGLTLSEALTYYDQTVDSDAPLLLAIALIRRQAGTRIFRPTQDECVAILERALKG